MRLHKELTTVTPFSKMLALSLFIIVPMITFFMGLQYQKNIDTVTFAQMPSSQNTMMPSSVAPTPFIIWEPNNQTIRTKIGQTVTLEFNRGIQAWYQDYITKSDSPDVVKLVDQHVDNRNIWTAHYKVVRRGNGSIETSAVAICPKDSTICTKTHTNFIVNVIAE